MFNSYSSIWDSNDLIDSTSLSRINICSESVTSERNILSLDNNSSNSYERNIFSSNIFTNNMHMNDSIPSQIDNKKCSEFLTLNAYGGEDICDESKLNCIEQLNEKEDFFKSSDIICISSCEKSGKNINIVINDMSDYFNINNESNSMSNDNNEICFISKKRMLSEENHNNNSSIFTPSENDKDLKRFINEDKNNNEISSENSNIISEQKRHHSLNKKEKKKKQKNIKGRKYDNDLIMKKIKKRFLKDLKNKVNENLKLERCRKQFKYFPPLFADNLTKEINKSFLHKTLKDLFSTDFVKIMEEKNIKKKIDNTDSSNYEHNISVLDTLKRNPKYKQKFEFFNLTYAQLFKDYLVSKEFEIAIDDLKEEEEEEDEEYIKKYIIIANNYIDYFSK